MGNIDTSSKMFFRDPYVFADVFNFWLHDGAQIIKPENLREASESLISFPENPLQHVTPPIKKGKNSENTRDVVKQLVCMEDGESIYAILGIEGQTDVDYSMVARALIYDSRQLEKQINEIRARNKAFAEKSLSDPENSWWFYKSDKLVPVITIVVYLGTCEWNGPRNLQELYSINDPLILKYSPNYTMNLLEPFRLTSEDLTKFQTEMRTVMALLRAAGNKKTYRKLIAETARFPLSDNAEHLIRDLSGLQQLQPNLKKGGISMWQALIDIREEGREEGLNAGLSTVRMYMNGKDISSIAAAIGKEEAEVEKMLAEAGVLKNPANKSE